MHWPQITMIVLITLGLGVNLAEHGKPRTPHNFIVSLISAGISVALMSAGGFFGAN